MTEITVIETAKATVDINKLNEEEREIFFYNLSESIPRIPTKYFEDFHINQNKIIEYSNLIDKPEIKELLVRKIIQVVAYLYQLKNAFITNKTHAYGNLEYFLPIIREFIQTDEFRLARSKRRSTSGGADVFQPKRKPLSKKRLSIMQRETTKDVDIEKIVRLVFDIPTLTITSTNRVFIAPPEEEVDIVGFSFSSLCSKLEPKTNVMERILLGAYKPSYVMANCEVAKDVGFPQPEIKEISKNTYFFENTPEKTSLDILSRIFDYFADSVELYQGNSLIPYLMQTLIKNPKVFEGSHLAELFQIISQPFSYEDNLAVEPLGDDIKTINATLGTKINAGKGTNLIMDLDSLGLFRVYESIKSLGKDAKKVQAELNKLRVAKASAKFKEEIRKKQLEEVYQTNLVKAMIAKKLGREKLQEVENKLRLSPRLKGDEILRLLSQKEANVVKNEMIQRKKYFEAYLSNNCPHIKLYRRFRSARTDEDLREAYKKVREFFPPKLPEIKAKKDLTADDFIKCNNCGFDLICPHVQIYTDLLVAKKAYNEIKSKLFHFIDEKPLQGNYYCKICSEKVANEEMYEMAMSDEESRILSSISDELKTLMWSETAGILHFVRIGELINVPRLISTIIAGIYDFVFEIEKQLLRSKTNTAEDVKNKKRLFITIYVYAYLINLIFANKNKKESVNIDFKDVKGRAKDLKITDYVKYAITNIVGTKNVVISQIANISIDFIKNKLIEAYKFIAQKGPQALQTRDQAESIFERVIFDPIYHYLYYINMLDSSVSGAHQAKKTKTDLGDKFEFIMKGSMADVDKRLYLYDGARIPDMGWLDFEKRLATLRAEYDKGARVDYSGDNFKKAYKAYVFRAFQLYWQRISTKLYEKFITVEGVLTPEYEKYFEKMDEFLAQQNILFEIKSRQYAQNYVHLVAQKNRRFRPWFIGSPKAYAGDGDPKVVMLGEIYDEQGNKHKFNIYLYTPEGSSGSPQQGTASDILKIIEKEGQFKGKIIDRICSICKRKHSEVSKLDQKKIMKALETKNDIRNLFRFYQNLCPEEGLHAWEKAGETNRCKKCGMLYEMILDPLTEKAKGYYEKYKERFHATREETALLEEDVLKSVKKGELTEEKKAKLKQYEKEYEKWGFNFNVIVELASKLGVNLNVLNFVGVMEGKEFDLIADGKILPPEPDNKDDARIYNIETYIELLIRDYNTLKYASRVLKLPPDLSKLLDDAGVKRFEYIKLESALETIYDDFPLRLEYFLRTRKPREVVEFCLESLYSKCLSIYNKEDKAGELKTKKLRTSFVSYWIKKMIETEKRYTKPGQVNWTVLKTIAEQDVEDIIKTPYDENYDEDDNLETEEDLMEKKEELDKEGILEETDYGTTDDALKNKFDIDLEEGQDIEDFDNEIGVEDNRMSGLE